MSYTNNMSKRNHENFFLEFYEQYSAKMRQYANAILIDSALSEDVVHAAFLEFWNQIECLVTCEKPEWWLIKTVKHKAYQARREQLRNSTIDIETMEGDLVDTETQQIFESVEGNERGQFDELKRIIESVLTEEEMILFKRIIIGKEKASLVAQECGITVAACQKRAQRIKQKIIKNMKQQNVGID